MSEFDTLRSRTFSCPACGGRMVFDPAIRQLRCPYCGTAKAFEVTRETPNEYDIRFTPLVEDPAWGDRTRVARCGGCGAEIILTGETAVDECPFCGAAPVPGSEAGAGIAPESLIPFKITQEEAKTAFRKWIRRRPLAPNAARRPVKLGRIAGVYLSCWTYDDQATSAYEGEAGYASYADVKETVPGPDGKPREETRRERRVRWEPTAGVVEGTFDDIMTAGSERLPEPLLSGARPWQLTRLVRYSPEYIAGFMVEKPSADVRENWLKAQRVVDGRMADIARRDILSRADEAKVASLRTTHGGVRYKLTLLPLYLSAFSYRKKTYHVLLNGQTGQIGGRTPKSPVRVALAVLVLLAVMGGLFWLFMATGGREYMFHDFGGLLTRGSQA